MARDFRLIRRRYDAVEVEGELGIKPTDLQFPIGNPRRYGADETGAVLSTTAVQNTIDVASAMGNRAEVDLAGGNFLVGTLTIDARRFRIKNGTLTAHSSIPAGGALIVSLAGGDDEDVNQPLLDGIYGTDVVLVRTDVPGSLENVHIDNVSFVGIAGVALRAIWLTGFTRGCRITGAYITDFEDAGIVINGSWSFLLQNNFLSGNSVGVGIMLGTTGNGERNEATACNAVTMINNEVFDFDEGVVWDAGVAGAVVGNIWEFNITRGFVSQSVTGVAYHGNYHERNGATTNNNDGNLRIGGTNGSDFAEGWDITGNRFLNDDDAGHNIILRGIKNCRVGQNNYGGTRTQWYNLIANTGSTGLQSRNLIEIPDLDGTYATNASTEADAMNNEWYSGNGKLFNNVQNGNYTFTLLDPARLTTKNSGGGGETWTIPANSALAYPVNTVLEGRNLGGGTLTIAITTDTLQLAGGVTTGSRTIADGGVFRIKKDTTTHWVIEGTGVT